MNIEDKNGATVLRRTAEYKPGASIRNWLIGRPLPTADAPHQTIGKTIGLAVFSSDALSSVAYGPQEMLMILAVAGIGSLRYAVPLSFAIVLLLAILVFSYEQTIHAYPDGGGSYIVARDNLGDLYAETAGAALLTDYILTVAVSISSGVAQVVSAYPVLYPYRTILAVGMVLFIMVVNLRGVKESGLAFSLPTYLFIIMMYVTIGYGFFQLFTGTLGTVVAPPMEHIPNIVQPVTRLLSLRAFSNGTSALTCVEAISNGITAFKEPRSKNAGKTLIWMGVILGTLMLGITYLNFMVGGLPSEEETIISQMARTIYQGRGFIYLVTIFSPWSFDDGCQYRLCRFPPPECDRGSRRFPSPAAHIPGEPPGIFAWNRCAGVDCLRVDRHLSSQRNEVDSSVRHWRVSFVYAFTGGHGAPMV